MGSTFSGTPVATSVVQGRLFSDVMLTVAKETLSVRESTATANSGSKIALTDSTYTMKDLMAGGTIWFLSGGNLGLTRRIKQIKPGGIFTFDAVDVNIAQGDSYAVCEGDIPRNELISAVNEAIRQIGYVIEDTTLTAVAFQYSYDLPVDPLAVTDLTKVEVADYTGIFVENRHWDEVEGELRFEPGWEPKVDGATIRLTYKAAFAPFDDLDSIPLSLPDKLLHWKAVLNACKYAMRMHSKDRSHTWAETAQEAETRAQRASSSESPTVTVKRPKLSNY